MFATMLLEGGAPDFAKAPSWPVPNAGPRRSSKSEGGLSPPRGLWALTPVRQAQGPEPFRQAQGPERVEGQGQGSAAPSTLIAALPRCEICGLGRFAQRIARSAQRTLSEALAPALTGLQPLHRIKHRFWSEAAPR